MATGFACYRLPGDACFRCVEGKVEQAGALYGLADEQGFVLAPFHVGSGCPIVVIRPDRVSTHSLNPSADEGATQLVLPTAEANREAYHHDFEGLHLLLEDGKLSKVVLARKLLVPQPLPSLGEGRGKALFLKACQMYPQQMVALVSTEASGTWLMATPELLLGKGEDRWHTMALAGTMPSAGPWSEKNRKEHLLVVDFIRNCLLRHAYMVMQDAPRTVAAGSLYHLRTDFSFMVNDDAQISEVLADLFPTPAVCGLPKEEALEAILRYESIDRRYYSGFCGPFGLQGETQLFVSLRCMELADDYCALYAGGGLLKESEEESEWQETEAKLKTMKDVLG